MLVDTEKLHTVTEAREGLDYTPGEYERDTNVFVFRMTWDGEDEGDILNFADALDFVATFEDPEADAETYAEARELLNSGRAMRIGPDDDWYRISPLPQPMTHDRYGELVTLADFEATRVADDFGVRPGVDFPASLAG